MTHAWLFTGPPGSGRSVAARAFAAALLCPDRGCGRCASCRQVRAGTHADLMLVRPDGLSYGVKQTRSLVLRAAGTPSGGRWQRGAVRGRRPGHRTGGQRAFSRRSRSLRRGTVWLLCAPSAEELVTTIRSPMPPDRAAHPAVGCGGGGTGQPGRGGPRAGAGRRPGIGRAISAGPAGWPPIRRPPGGERTCSRCRRRVGRPRPGAGRGRRPGQGRGARRPQPSPRNWTRRNGTRCARHLVRAPTGKGVAKAIRGGAGALKDLDDRQKSRATRLKRDALDRALLDLAAFYRDLLTVQLRAGVELASAGPRGGSPAGGRLGTGVHGAQDRGDHGVP